MPNKTPPTKTPEKTPAEQRKAWADRANRAIGNLERAAKAIERSLKQKDVASAAQLKALETTLETALARVQRAAAGQSAKGGAIPTE